MSDPAPPLPSLPAVPAGSGIQWPRISRSRCSAATADAPPATASSARAFVCPIPTTETAMASPPPRRRPVGRTPWQGLTLGLPLLLILLAWGRAGAVPGPVSPGVSVQPEPVEPLQPVSPQTAAPAKPTAPSRPSGPTPSPTPSSPHSRPPKPSKKPTSRSRPSKPSSTLPTKPWQRPKPNRLQQPKTWKPKAKSWLPKPQS